MSLQRPLMSVLEKLLHVCNSLGVPVWLDFGTLLGCVRHNNIIPWDWDVDVNIWDTDSDRLFAYIAAGNCSGISVDTLYYGEDSCAYVFDTMNPDVGIDLILYHVDTDNQLLQHRMSSKIVEQYEGVYTHDLGDVLPLRRVLFLGNEVFIPSRATIVLEQNYGSDFMTPLSADFERWKNSADGDERCCRSPFVLIPEVASVSEGLRTHRDVPFIVRNCAQTFPAADRIVSSLMKESSSTLFGYGSSPQTESEEALTGFIDPAVALARLRSGELNLNILDSFSSDPTLNPSIIEQHQSLSAKSKGESCCYVLTNRNTVTAFHTDPPFGSGWMFLCYGWKIWWIIAPSDWNALQQNGVSEDALSKMSFTDAVHACDKFLWGKIFVGSIRDGDFIHFPQSAPHSVRSYAGCFGISGYV
eukprot:ANDGO_00310.mRNA.1 Uncharacterized protein L613